MTFSLFDLNLPLMALIVKLGLDIVKMYLNTNLKSGF